MAVVYRHTDPYGGTVDYRSKEQADAAKNVRGGKVEQIDPRTGAVLSDKELAANAAASPHKR